MKFFAAVLALASAAFVYADSTANPFNIPTGGYQTSAGSTVNLTWTPTTSGTVSLVLRYGNSAYLNQSGTIAAGIANSGSYLWLVPSDIVRGSSYAVEIISDQDTSLVNYTPQFIIDSSVLTTSSGASLVASATSTGSTTVSVSTSGSVTVSTTVTGSASTSASTSGASTTGTTSTSKTASSAGVQTVSATGLAAPRATVMAGMLGVVALGALAL